MTIHNSMIIVLIYSALPINQYPKFIFLLVKLFYECLLNSNTRHFDNRINGNMEQKLFLEHLNTVF